MTDAFVLLVSAILRLFRARRRLLLENLALRQQLAALKRRHPRPRLAVFDKLFWVLARRFWCGWKDGHRGGTAQKQKPPGKKKKNHLDTNRPSHGSTWPHWRV